MTQLRRLPADEPAASVCEALLDDGGLVVEGFLPTDELTALREEVEPALGGRRPGYRSAEFDDFYGATTRRLTGLARRSPTFVSSVLLHPLLASLCDRLLLPTCGRYWMNLGELISVGPGEPAQQLHRDDLNYPVLPELAPGLVTEVEALIALSEYTEALGATRVVPGSHREPASPPPDPARSVAAEMSPGDALLYLNGTWHGAGANTSADRWRTALHISFVLGWLTPEEAAPLSLSPDDVAALPPRARALLGWASHEPDPEAGLSPLWQLDDDDVARHAGLFAQGAP